jgi:cytochrome c oxidase subunit 4
MSTDHSHADGSTAAHADGAVHVHIASVPFYAGIFVGLVFLTVLTVIVSYFDFGSANIFIAILIATIKASLVSMFFMHLAHDKVFNTISFFGAFLFLGVFILLSYDDLGRRGRLDNSYGGSVDLRTGIAAPGGEPATSATQDSREDEGPPRPGEKAAPSEKAEKKE